jgi:hypothetical protein
VNNVIGPMIDSLWILEVKHVGKGPYLEEEPGSKPLS